MRQSSLRLASKLQHPMASACEQCVQVVRHLLGRLPTPETVVLQPVRELGEVAAKGGRTLTWAVQPAVHTPGEPCPCLDPAAGGLQPRCTCVAVTALIGGRAVGRCGHAELCRLQFAGSRPSRCCCRRPARVLAGFGRLSDLVGSVALCTAQVLTGGGGLRWRAVLQPLPGQLNLAAAACWVLK